ncbi:hypothetical protein [Paraburkholderia sp. 40]
MSAPEQRLCANWNSGHTVGGTPMYAQRTAGHGAATCPPRT